MRQWKAVLLIVIFFLGIGSRIILKNHSLQIPQGSAHSIQVSGSDSQNGLNESIHFLKSARGKRKARSEISHESAVAVLTPFIFRMSIPQVALLIGAQLELTSFSANPFVPPPSPFVI